MYRNHIVDAWDWQHYLWRLGLHNASKAFKVLINHDLVEKQEHWFHEHHLELNFELKSFEEWQEAKCQKNANKDIYKMLKPLEFHGKDNTTPKKFISFLKTL